MKSEKEKMLAGKWYNALDPELTQERLTTRLLLKRLNDSREDEIEERKKILTELLPNASGDLWLQPPFFCDYGYNIAIGEKVFFNFNCVVLDVAPVRIGSRTMFGPNVQIYTATHPLEHKLRNSGKEYAKPITIGNNVWIGGGAIICPGVTLGDNTVVAAGAVVTKSFPNDVVIGGNPAKVIKTINNN